MARHRAGTSELALAKHESGLVQVMTEKSADERRSTRANVLLTAAIECGGVRIPVRVSNLSAHGALVLSDAVLEEGASVIYRCNGMQIEGWIAWVRPPHAGIQFGEPIPHQDLLRSAPVPHQMIIKDSRKLDHRRPGFRGKQLTADEKRILEEWRASQ
jgi:hypothetical protein